MRDDLFIVSLLTHSSVAAGVMTCLFEGFVNAGAHSAARRSFTAEQRQCRQRDDGDVEDGWAWHRGAGHLP